MTRAIAAQHSGQPTLAHGGRTGTLTGTWVSAPYRTTGAPQSPSDWISICPVFSRMRRSSC